MKHTFLKVAIIAFSICMQPTVAESVIEHPQIGDNFWEWYQIIDELMHDEVFMDDISEIVLDFMWALLLSVVFGIWVFIDARVRENHSIGWPVLTFILGPVIALPFYFACRNLKAGEIREGGTGWNVIKNFALIWTLFIVFIILVVFLGGLGFSSLSEGGADQAVVIVGLMAFGFIMMAIWFCVAVPMLVLGLLIKQSSVVERGPTGPLKYYQPRQPPV